MTEITKSFSDDLKKVFALPGSSSPEDQLKAPVANLIASFGEIFNVEVATKTEAHLSEQKVRPDIAVYAKSLINGYIELKAPGFGADAPKLKGKHNKEQWRKLQNLPNLIYTDGREWALYRTGERVGSIVRFADDPVEVGAKAVEKQDAERLEALISDFLIWKPHVPHRPRELAEFLAPLTRFLRSEVEHALIQEGSNVGLLAAEWRQYFFPDADDAQFADAYAQTVTYAMLLARLSGATSLSPADAAKTLDKGNGLLARVLELLGQPDARDELRVGFELLQRSLEALDPFEFLKAKPDLWLYFYEDFLAAYDPKLRRDYGIYYTPREIVELQVRLASELLEDRFGKKLGFADDGVVFLDPAVGTGTYLVAAVKNALEKVRERSGEGAVPERATQMAENMYGFEILVGPYAVAHLRLTQALEGAGASISDRVKVYLADTLESPNATPPGGLTLTYKALTQEHEAARKLKQGSEILVCLGNPPYDRQNIEEGDTTTQRKGGWVRFSDWGQGRVTREDDTKAQDVKERPIFADFTEPASKAGAGVHIKNLYNDYVYFWRWALWRLFEQQTCGGIVTFITASSYLAGPGFIGVREVMRRTFDDLWIIDLGGDNLGTRKTPNVFNIQTPVAIAIGVRGKTAAPDTPAKTLYTKVSAETRNAKLLQLEAVDKLEGLSWQECPDDWHAPFLPAGKGDFFDWPRVVDLMPWSHSGCELKRSWPIGETREVLAERWEKLLCVAVGEKDRLMRRTDARNKDKAVNALLTNAALKPIRDLSPSDPPEMIGKYSYRSFDNQFVILDGRVGDRFRPQLIGSRSERQIYLVTLQSHPLGFGSGATCCAFIPDRHNFRGSYSGKDVIPLYRDAAATEPNVTAGLLTHLSDVYGFTVSAEDLAAYIYALLGGQSYTARFWNELESPGPRVPITMDGATFATAAKLGRRLIWLHTYAERFRDEDLGDEIPAGAAKCIAAVPSNPAKYPETFEYKPLSKEIFVGEGRFGPVSPEVWNFEVSGLKVVQSWLGYRMKVRAGRKSSPLDDIRPERWTPRMTDEFLELLWVLESTLAMEPDLSAALDTVVTGECFKASELRTPTEAERKPPKVSGGSEDQTVLFDDADHDDD